MKKGILLLLISLVCLITNAANTSSSSSTTQCNSYTWYGITYTNSGAYTHTSTNSSGGIHTETLNLTINHTTYSSQNVTACNAYTWSNGQTYILGGIYSYTTINTKGCDSILTLTLTMNQGVRISPKVFLGGAYDSNTGLMKDSLRAAVALGDPAGYIPTPYLIPPHIPTTPTNFLPANGAAISPGVLSIAGSNAIVDWIYIEVRDATNNNIVVATKHALLQRDGDVVSTDGISSLFFPTLCQGNYYISIKHRNHLGVMTATPIALTATTQLINFTNGNVWLKPGITNPPMKQIQGVYTLIAGDANNSKSVKFNGSSNDKENVLNAVIGAAPPGYPFPPSMNTVYGYRNEDLNMDGKVRYYNADNDKLFLLEFLLGVNTTNTPNTILSQHTPN